ncbi:MAG: hypothetical protein WD851_15845 [Pirellulales bacterium]
MDCQSNTLAGCKHRRAWMAGKPPLIALLASAPVLAADECYDLLQVISGALTLPVSLQPEQVEEWLLLYTDHRLVTRVVAEAFLERNMATLNSNEDDLTAFLLGDAGTVGTVDFLDDSFWQTVFERIEVRFFFRVLMPCVVWYGRSPVELLATVGRSGPNEWDSIEKLVALDPLIVQHRRFARLLNCDDARLRRERAELLGECLGKPLPTLSKRRVKMMLAGHMSRMSEILGCRLSEPEIRDLFDAIAKDHGLGLRDTDLPLSAETFSKTIQRYRKFWKLPGGPDKDIRETVRALEAALS